MKYTRWIIAFAWLIVLCATPASAAPDAPAGWSNSVDTFLSALIDRVPAETIESSLQQQKSVRDFARKEASIQALLTASANVDWARALSYRDMPDTLATDIANIIADAPLDDSLKQYLTPDGDAATRRANITAMKWISHTLGARQNQPIAVMMMHKPAADANAAGSLLVVLMAGERVGSDVFRIKQIAFGQFPGK